MTSDHAIPVLTDEVPGAPRAETLAYRFPPARPCALPADRCNDADLRQIVEDALGNRSDLLALLGSPEHVLRILGLARRQATQLAARTAELVGERLEVRRLGDLLIQSSQLLVEVQAQHRVVSAENLALRRRSALDVAFDRAAQAVTGRGAVELTAELEDQTQRYPTPVVADDRFDDTEVVDVEQLTPDGVQS